MSKINRLQSWPCNNNNNNNNNSNNSNNSNNKAARHDDNNPAVSKEPTNMRNLDNENAVPTLLWFCEVAEACEGTNGSSRPGDSLEIVHKWLSAKGDVHQVLIKSMAHKVWPRMDTPRARSLEQIGICFQISSPIAWHTIFVPPIETREVLFKRHFSQPLS